MPRIERVKVARKLSRCVAAARACEEVPWNTSWNHQPAQPGDFRDLRTPDRGVCPVREAGTTEQATFNLLIQGSTPGAPPSLTRNFP